MADVKRPSFGFRGDDSLYYDGSSMLTGLEPEVWKPATAEERAAVREELERLLQHPTFSQSRRYPQFLRFVVAHSLESPGDLLKERMLGHEVFGKAPDYDTASDPVVRVTATEIRKRLAQYYRSEEHQAGIRIVLPLGSYSPQFFLPDAPTPLPLLEVAADAGNALQLPVEETTSATQGEPVLEAKTHSRWGLSHGLLLGIVGTLLVVAVILTVWHALRQRDVSAFWAPMVSSSAPLLVCIPDQTNNSALPMGDAANPNHQSIITVNRNEAAMADLPPLVNVVGVMQANKQSFRIKGTTSTSLDDLRGGPSVLIGAYSNPWTLRLTESMRFHFANDPEMKQLWIADRQNPGSRAWTRSTTTRGKDVYYEDHALLVRFKDANTGQYVVVAAGLGHGGTLAAGEFLASPADLNRLLKLAPKGWKGQNLEAVLSTNVVGDQAGAPHIVATHFW